MHGQDKRRPSRRPRRLAPGFCKEGRHGARAGNAGERPVTHTGFLLPASISSGWGSKRRATGGSAPDYDDQRQDDLTTEGRSGHPSTCEINPSPRCVITLTCRRRPASQRRRAGARLDARPGSPSWRVTTRLPRRRSGRPPTSSSAEGILETRRKAFRGSRKSSHSRARQNVLRGASRRLKVEPAPCTGGTRSRHLRRPRSELLPVARRGGAGDASLRCSQRHHRQS